MKLREVTHAKLFKILCFFSIVSLFLVLARTQLHIAEPGLSWNSEESIWLIQLNHPAHPTEDSERLYTNPLVRRLKALEGVDAIFGFTQPNASIFILSASQYDSALMQHAHSILDEVVNSKSEYATYQFVMTPREEIEQTLSLGFKSQRDDEGRLWDIAKAMYAPEKNIKAQPKNILSFVKPDVTVALGMQPVSEKIMRTTRELSQLDGVMSASLKNITIQAAEYDVDTVRASHLGLLAGDVVEKTRALLNTPYAAAMESTNEKNVTTRQPFRNSQELFHAPLYFFEQNEINLAAFSHLKSKLIRVPILLADYDALTQAEAVTSATPAEIEIVFAPGADVSSLKEKTNAIVSQNLGQLPISWRAQSSQRWEWCGYAAIIVLLCTIYFKNLADFQQAALALILVACGGLLLSLTPRFTHSVFVAATFTLAFIAKSYEARADKKNLPVGLLGRVSAFKILFLFTVSMLLVQWLYDAKAIALSQIVLLNLTTLSLWITEMLALSPQHSTVDILRAFDKAREKTICTRIFALFAIAAVFTSLIFVLRKTETTWHLGLKDADAAAHLFNQEEQSHGPTTTQIYGYQPDRSLLFTPSPAGRGPGYETLLTRATALFGWQNIGWMNVNGVSTLIRLGDQRFIDQPNVDSGFQHAQSWLSQIVAAPQNHTPLSKFATVQLAPRPGLALLDSNGDSFRIDLTRPASSNLSELLMQKGYTTSFHLQSDLQVHREVVNGARLWAALLGLVTFLLSGLLFNSLGRSFRLTATFLFLYVFFCCVAHTTQMFGLSTAITETLELELPLYFSVLLATLSTSVAVASDSRRLSGLSRCESFHFCTTSFHAIAKTSFILTAISCLLIFCEIRMITIALLCLGTSLFLRYMAIGWFMIWIDVTESFYKYGLRWSIGIVKRVSLSILVCLLASNPFSNAHAAESVQSISANCSNLVTIVFPLHGRPKGFESPVVKSVYTERLAQEIPCSYIELDSSSELIDLHKANRETRAQTQILKSLENFLQKQNAVVTEGIKKHFPQFQSLNPPHIRVLGGYFEEFFGATAFTIIEIEDGVLNGVVKKWYAPGEEVIGIAKLAQQLKNDDSLFIEDIIQKHQRVPVYLRQVESLDKQPISENLSEEVDVFLRSRLKYPSTRFVFDRKAFFTEGASLEQSKYVVDLKIRRDGVRMFASGLVESNETHARRTFWVESDVSNIHRFAETIMDTLERELATLDGIFDYVLALGPEFWFQNDHPTRFATLQFRQNRGNVALGLRLRNGELDSTDTTMRAITVGGMAGWQFVDVRWLAADIGLSVDVGSFGETFKKLFFERSLIATYGGYAQTQFIFYKNLAVIVRAGIEKPMQISVNPEATQLLLPSLSESLLIGLGVAF